MSNIDSLILGSTIVDITIFDFDGNSITKLPDTLTICLKEEKTNDEICLGYFNIERGEWECEDKCLSRKNGQYCGTTDHLTSFALLLQGKKGGECDNSDDFVFAWISMGLIILAILIICVFVMLNEVRYILLERKKTRIMGYMNPTETNW